MTLSRTGFRALLLASAALLLVACAGNPSRPGAAAPGQAPARAEVVVRSTDPQDYRFHMEQDGRKMSADEFDAWMKARGIRIATGAPAQGAAAPAKAGASTARAGK